MNTLKRVPVLRALEAESFDCMKRAGQLNMNLLPAEDFDVSDCEPSRAIYLSPIDRIKTGKRKRGRELGYRVPTSSFDGNKTIPARFQSSLDFYDRVCDKLRQLPLRSAMERLTGDAVSMCSFSPGFHRSNLHQSVREDNAVQSGDMHSVREGRLNASFDSSSQPPTMGQPHKNSITCFPTAAKNPQTAMFTLDIKTTNILMVNSQACELLGYTSEELGLMSFVDLIRSEKHKNKVLGLGQNASDEKACSSLLTGKVVEFQSKTGIIIPIFMWMKPLEEDGRFLAMAEPVQRRKAKIIVDSTSNIIEADQEALQIFQCEEGELQGHNLRSFIPSFLEHETIVDLTSVKFDLGKKQMYSGLTVDTRQAFPLILRVVANETSHPENPTFTAIVWVFANISGLIVIEDNGLIDSCNHHFTHLMFGYTQEELIGQSISKIIPNFCNHFCDNSSISHSTGNMSEFERIDSTKDHSAYESAEGEDFHFIVRRTPEDIDQSEQLVYNSTFDHNYCDKPPNVIVTKCDIDAVSSSKISASLDCIVQEVSCMKASPDREPPKQSNSMINLPSSDMSKTNNTSKAKVDPPESLSLDVENKLEDQEDDTPTVSPHNYEEPFELADMYPIETDDDKDVIIKLAPLVDYPRTDNSPTLSDDLDFMSADGTDDAVSLDGEDNEHTPVALVTSTPSRHRYVSSKKVLNEYDTQNSEVKHGLYSGYGVHKDGVELDITYRVKIVQVVGGRFQYLIWVSLDAPGRSSKENETVMSTALDRQSMADGGCSDSVSSSIVQCRSESSSFSIQDDQLTSGPYGEAYTNLKQIGKGAHGCVFLAYRHSDQLLVVTKFINKTKILTVSLCEFNGKSVPLEIKILQSVQHPGIVKVLDVFENDKFHILVMEKHGPSMDLFEFIDRKPKLDEPLISYIFRQVVFTLDYLYSKLIIHRDIKDENMIIDQHFSVKLIDFGSATHARPGHYFSTFFGTVEYCSPEVLEGNGYAGPELEMWALGVTLYIMVFGENPFFNVEETLKAEIVSPGPVSRELNDLIHWMLEKDVQKRCKLRQLVENEWLNQPVDITKYSFKDVVHCKPEEYNPPVYYSEYHPDTPYDITNSSLSLHEEVHNENSECSSNSIGSLTTIENFDSEDVRQSCDQGTRPSASVDTQTPTASQGATDIPYDETSNYDDDEFPELSDDSDESFKDPENIS